MDDLLKILIGVTGLLAFLKILNVINLSWLLVFLPILLPLSLFLFFCLFLFFVGIFMRIYINEFI